jgi:hypothetical protein
MGQDLVRYHSIIADNARWEGFPFRDGDIVLSTPAKCGTTWTQTILALLIFQTPEPPAAMDLVSPWFDQLLRDRDSVLHDLESQTHRRFIKTHTPLDGLPWDDRVTYITVARDPRDVARSWDNHMANINLQAMMELRGKAVGFDDLNEVMPDGIPTFPETEIERFWMWIESDEAFSVSTLTDLVHHLRGFWEKRDLPNVVLLHYGDMKADLEGQMRALAERLGIAVPEERWPQLVPLATFESMKQRAAATAPNSTESIWVDTDRFFNRGTSGQWRELLDDEGLRRYQARMAELTDPELADWLHNGPIAT